MPSKGQQIHDALTTEIRKVVGIGSTGSNWKLWREENRFPAAYTILDSDAAELSPTRTKTVTAEFLIATIISSGRYQNAFYDLRRAIETEIEDDPTLGGLSDEAWIRGVGPFATTQAIAGEVYVRDIFVRVIYKYPRGAP